MTREEIVRMARQTGSLIELAQEKDLLWLEDFAKLVAQRTWVGLTPEDTFEIGERLGLSDIAWVDLMQAIEAKLKEKNFN